MATLLTVAQQRARYRAIIAKAQRDQRAAQPEQFAESSARKAEMARLFGDEFEKRAKEDERRTALAAVASCFAENEADYQRLGVTLAEAKRAVMASPNPWDAVPEHVRKHYGR